MIYKMTLKDSTDEMTFNLLEVPIVDKDIEGAVDNVTLDGNQYTDYLYLKKQYIQKWSIMCDEEYERLRGFYTRQFDEAEIPTYELYYGETIYNDYTLSGDYILADVQGVEPARMSLAQLNGNATQTTYSGKNLFGIEDASAITQNGITISVSNDAISMNGTATTSFGVVITSLKKDIVFENGTSYTFSKETTGSVDGSWALQFRDANDATILETNPYFYPTTVSNASGTAKAIRLYIASGRKFTNYTIKIQLEKGSTATSYEPYVGGTPAPNPDYPQEIKTVTGENVVKVIGKNLFDINTLNKGSITVTDGVASGTALQFHQAFGTDGIQPPIPNQQFTITATAYTDGNASTAETTGLTVRALYTDGTLGNLLAWDNSDTTASTKTGTTSNAKTLQAIRISYNNQGGNIWHLSNIQLELGSTATTYEPYQGQEFPISLGTLELAKIPGSDYRDKILYDKTTGKWYIEKQVGKVVLDGTETWNLQNMTAGKNYYTMISTANGGSQYPIMNNMGTFGRFDSSTPSIAEGECFISPSKNLNYFANTFSDTNALKTALGLSPMVVYYTLATPTTTEITNQTLIDQLEALVNVSIATGIHNIFTEVASGNLNPTMILNFIEVVSQRVTLVPETPVRLTLTDGGVINACGCRKDVQLTMRETIE